MSWFKQQPTIVFPQPPQAPAPVIHVHPDATIIARLTELADHIKDTDKTMRRLELEMVQFMDKVREVQYDSRRRTWPARNADWAPTVRAIKEEAEKHLADVAVESSPT